LDALDDLLADPDSGWPVAHDILGSTAFSRREFKKTFNRYSDNIYMAPDDDRANDYLDGGATPDSRQTMQYLLRNDALGHIEDLSAEVAYLLREQSSRTDTAAA
ncbi:unnamed protein product, partial [Phaeothamnion confervicola]